MTTAIIHDMWDTEYHSMRDVLSSTGARKLLPPSTPAHFDAWRDAPATTSDAFDLGHVVHRIVLGKGADYFPMDPQVHGLKKDGSVADSPKATGAWKAAESEARTKGLVPIHIDDLSRAQRMAKAVFCNPDANALFVGDGDAEVSIFADDPITGVPLRARVDWLDGTLYLDVKTTTDAAPGEFDRLAAKYGYHVQEMFYRHVAESAGLTVDRFAFVAVETKCPHLVVVHEWDDEARTIGKRAVRQAIDTFAECSRTDTWPGYPMGGHVMSLPTYLLDDEMMEIA